MQVPLKMCLILQKLNQCLNSSDVSTNEVGFWCLSELYAMKIVLPALHIVTYPLHYVMISESRKINRRRGVEQMSCEKWWCQLVFHTRGSWASPLGRRKKCDQEFFKLCFISVSSEGDCAKRTSFSVFSLLWVWVFFSLSLLQCFSLVKICLQQETKLLSLLGIRMMSTWDSSRKWG